MRRFLIRRAISIVISILGATMVIFILSRMGPDPIDIYLGDTQVELTQEYIDMVRADMGLDKSLPEQYLIWLWNIAHLDLGESLGMHREVSEMIRQHLPITLQLAIGAWIFAITVGLTMGVLAAVKRATPWDYIARTMALFGQATPQFWTGVMAILIFAVILGWLPAGTLGTREGFPLSWERIQYWIMPCIVLGWPASAGIMRLTRSAMLEVIDSEYIKLARAKGVSGNAVIWKHALRNSVIPPLTSAMVLLADYLNGALVVEIIFSIPGIGQVALSQAVYQNDWPLLAATVLCFIGIYVTFAFIADVTYALIDPRIRYA